jgi:hypothetical protein
MLIFLLGKVNLRTFKKMFASHLWPPHKWNKEGEKAREDCPDIDSGEGGEGVLMRGRPQDAQT